MHLHPNPTRERGICEYLCRGCDVCALSLAYASGYEYNANYVRFLSIVQRFTTARSVFECTDLRLGT
jgi:hypothetical protein